MSNEELCARIKAGETDYIPCLWDNVSRFISYRAGKYLIEYPEHMQYLKDDMVNQAYFYFLNTIENYNPDKGKFITLLSYYIHNAFMEVLQGGRTERKRRNPLNEAVSIYAPVNVNKADRDTEDLTLLEIIADKTGEIGLRNVEENSFWDNIGAFIAEGLLHVKDKTGAKLIRYMYVNDCTVKAAVNALYGKSYPTAYDHYRKAMRQLKSYIKRAANKERLKAMALDEYIYTWGIKGWKSRRFTSSTEYSAIKRIEADERNSP